MKTYDEVYQNVLSATKAHQRKMRKIQQTASISAVCTACVLGVTAFMRLQKPLNIPSDSQDVSRTIPTMTADEMTKMIDTEATVQASSDTEEPASTISKNNRRNQYSSHDHSGRNKYNCHSGGCDLFRTGTGNNCAGRKTRNCCFRACCFFSEADGNDCKNNCERNPYRNHCKNNCERNPYRNNTASNRKTSDTSHYRRPHNSYRKTLYTSPYGKPTESSQTNRSSYRKN